MAIAYRSASSNTNDSVTTHTCPIPSGVAAGDVLIMGVQAYLNGSPINTPSGWTLQFNHGTTTGGAAQRNFAVYTRVADGTEGSTLTMTSSGAAYTQISIAAYSGGTGIDVTGDQPGGVINTGSTVSVATVTTTAANDMLVSVIVEMCGGSGDTVTPNTGFTSRYTSPFGATLNAKIFFLDKTQATAGSTGANNHTISSVAGFFYCNYLIAIKQTAATPPVADFTGTPLSGTRPLSVAFTDTSTGTPTSWDWDFGDGSTHSTSQNPTHSYTAAGTYTVALTATNAGGSNTKTRTAYVTVSNPAGAASKVRYGANLTVTDQGSGTILVDSPSGHLPAGGTSGQALTKTSATDYATQWSTLTTLPTDVVVAAATRIIASFLAAGDTQPAWRVLGDGKHQWGPGGTTATDTNLYRASSALLATDGGLLSVRPATTGISFGTVGAVGDTNFTFAIQRNGAMYWGPGGTSAPDTDLYRGAGGFLKTDQNFVVSAGLYVGNAAAGTTAANGILFGVSTDATLYRAASQLLKTDGQFQTNGVATYTAAAAAVDGIFTNPIDGLLYGDTLNNRLWIRLNGTWRYVTLT